MENHTVDDLPDEKEIEELLSQFKPKPTNRFFSRMSVAPWHSHTAKEGKQSNIKIKPGRRLAWGLTALGLVIILMIISFIPAVRVAADQIIHLFLPAASNQLEIQVTLTKPGDQLDFSNPVNFPISVSVAQELAGFAVKQISPLPEGLEFTGARYDQSYHAVTLLYAAINYKLFLTQRPIRGGQDVFSIGPDTQVELVKIGEIQGEFVSGGWKAISTQPVSSNETIAPAVSIKAVWDDNLHQSTLRWQREGVVYELRSNGDISLTQSELLKLANGLK